MNKHVIGQLSDVDLRLLRIFRVIVEAGGFSAAEVVLNISSAAISVAVSDLETRLGFRLCQRGRSGFSLTEEGREIYEYILQLFSSIEDFKTQINGLHTQLKGELNIGITDTLVSMPKMTITNSLALLKDQGPDVVINIWMMPPNDVELGILKGRLHVGIMPTTKQISGLEYHDLYSERSQLYCEASHPLFGSEGNAQVDQWPAVLPAYVQSAEIKTHQQCLSTEAAATATDREGIAFLILTGRYIGYLPDHFAQPWVNEGRLHAIEPQTYFYDTRFSYVTRKSTPKNLVLKAFLQHMAAQAEQTTPAGG